MTVALAHIGAAFDEAAVVHGFKLRVERIIALPPDHAAVLLALGALETREFHRQSDRCADAWGERVTGLLRVPERHHFSVIDDQWPQLKQRLQARLAAHPSGGSAESTH